MENNQVNRSSILWRVVMAAIAILAIAVHLPAAIAQSPAFNNGSLKGGYSFLMTEWTSTPSDEAENILGVLTFDGAGKVSGSFTSNSAGTIKTKTLSGTYSVKNNGTGTANLKTSNGSKVTVALVIDASAKNIQLMETDCQQKPCNYLFTGVAVAQVSTSFNNASLQGTYGFIQNEWTPDPTVPPFASLGIVNCDGAGNLKVTETQNTGGTIQTQTLTGTYSVNTDGTGSYLFKDTKGNETDGVLAVNAAGKGFQLMNTKMTFCGNSCGDIVWSGTATHQ